MAEYEPVTYPPIPKRLLVVGAPRSGTRFITFLLNSFCMRVRHERMGRDGTVNASWAVRKLVDDPLITIVGRQQYEFDMIIHLVRDPRLVIDSLSRETDRVWWNWQENHTMLNIPDPRDLQMIAAFWVFWTDTCQQLCDITVRMEDIQHLAHKIGKGVKKQTELKLDDLGGMADTVAERCETYGYDS